MKLGLFDHMQKHDIPARSYIDLYKSHLEVVEMADQEGMDFYFVAEHHFDMGFSECPSPGSFLGAASQRTKRIRLGPLVYVLPLWNPIRVAEEIAMLDNLTEGRLECGFGAGIGPFSFAAYNVPWDDKRQITLEPLRPGSARCSGCPQEWLRHGAPSTSTVKSINALNRLRNRTLA